jgi:pimeloyl-ACP methyl ester carboxylesterase
VVNGAIAVREREVAGTTIAYLERGAGEPVFLLHGFPDSAWTWEYQLAELAAAGYRVIAPFLPGYPPSGVPPGGEIRFPDVVEHVADFVAETAGGTKVVLVGHDWGATLAYAIAAARPEQLSSAAMLAVPHPATSAQVIEDPAMVQENFHHWFFQLPNLPEAALAANDLAFINYLWESWSLGAPNAGHVERVKRETLGQPGAIAAALGYYRQMYEALVAGRFAVGAITVPSLVIFGAEDPHRRLAEGQEQWFADRYEFRVIPGARHFLQHERPRDLASVLLEWLARRGRRTSVGHEPT